MRRTSGPRSLLVVGTGLIGTSVALAATGAGYQVWLDDRDPDRVAMAVAVGAGQPARSAEGNSLDALPAAGVDLAVVAVVPTAIAVTTQALLDLRIAPAITHTGSVQNHPQQEVEALCPGADAFVGSHPVAGRERSGPHHASADLFVSRPWIVCPTPSSTPSAVDAVRDLARACGAVVTAMPADAHDALFARLSHVPQLLASALAATVVGLARDEVALAGTGIRDTSRLADSDGELWAEIVGANAQPVAAALHSLLAPLDHLVAELESSDPVRVGAAVRELMDRGHRGRALLGGKHGKPAVRWATVAVVVPDEPGALARLLADAARAQVNVEDIRVDHSPGQPLGLVELDVAPDRGETLEHALAQRGWTATASPPPTEH
ncbi:MAG TPA: prephenate dehydrogenase [Mycobacteriales bacterium]|nr:prephenate dehydrogenase [Mycobacteriales bacterium]